jgi:glycosyltransferase involved in cell wall biosynthesis
VKPAVHQLLAALSYGDAIGNEALAIRAHLREAGYDSEIFAEQVHPRMARLARPLWRYREVSSPRTVCLFHFSIGSAASRLIHQAADRLVVIYHNITPAHWFAGFHSHLARLCHHGRRELAAFAARAELALGDSEFNRRELEQAGYLKTGVLPIVLDLAAYRRARSPMVRRLYADGRVNVLFVGRIIPNKRIEDLIRAFAFFRRRSPGPARLLLVGDYRGQERYFGRLQQLVRELRVDDVVFTGQVDHDELLAYYSVARVFLCLSEHEGYCVPLVEAMELDVPVVAYDAGAVAETLRGGGVLLADKSPELVAGVLHELAAEGPLRQAVLASQRRAIGKLRATRFGELLLARLQPVLDGAR